MNPSNTVTATATTSSHTKQSSSSSSSSNLPSSTPQSNSYKSPSTETLQQAFENTLIRYKQQLPFQAFLQHFPDDFSLENFDTLQKLYHVWLQNLEVNLRKEFEAILGDYDLRRRLYEKDLMSVIGAADDGAKKSAHDHHHNSARITHQNSAGSSQGEASSNQANYRQHRTLIEQYNTINAEVEQQIETKKEKINRFMTQLNESIEKMQQVMEHWTTR
mmetsp:Transcript_716/g.2388  ORF Transcript_716/g.2388 Transcript_716/m.2388 type:complete len:218 (-) Transcript_716:3642-4295(-)